MLSLRKKKEKENRILKNLIILIFEKFLKIQKSKKEYYIIFKTFVS